MNIETERLVLRAVEPDDAGFLADLINDPEVRASLGAYDLVYPVSKDMEEKWIRERSARDDESHLIVTCRRGRGPLGMLSIKDINWRNSSAHITIMLERASWDKGYGSEAVSGALDFLFNKMNMHRVWLRVVETNARAIRCYEKCGFRREGTLREDVHTRGRWRSSHIMSVLADEFRGRKR